MRQHVPDDLLSAFVHGVMGEQLAVHIAEHIDACPACATRATALEPLAVAFAAVEDPPLPEGLVEAVLARAARPEPGSSVPFVVALVLLAAAALVAALGGDLLQNFVQLGVHVDGLAALWGAVGRLVTSSAIAVTLASLAAFSTCLVTARVAVQDWRLP